MTIKEIYDNRRNVVEKVIKKEVNMSFQIILLVIAIVLFVLLALGVVVSGVNLLAWGLVAFAASFLPIRS